ncbi:glutathione S-transferase family protein [Halomicroarcula sp. F13]|uniref:Glutathione S-transferase family protein n=1 Tax=Haloarcula rubra TaxID=2487747 RepID=A0AAW4PTB7_9EURY|nr:glutathione S-transferase family protein [Halomicroarcula rubra]MBX0324364.1 glutathione S-transferase family protein [Halomicroarcula rubra]
MGKLIEGEWITAPERGHDSQGFDDWIRDPSEHPEAKYVAEPDRYHLYISRACPWAHRAALVRTLKGLDDVISVDIVDPVRRDDGWEFTPSKDGCTPDSVHGFEYLRDVYTSADPAYTGRVTVPVLYDTETETIVNNESADIARMLDQAFGSASSHDIELYPEAKQDQIDSIIGEIHDKINLGVYEAGFAENQVEYERAVDTLFEGLERWDDVLQDQRFLAGDQLTLADIFLFPTLFRFDLVYYTHFKCNVQRLVDFENLWPYARDIYQHPSVQETCVAEHVKDHYYRSHEDINPTGFVPVGPDIDWPAAHDRDRLGGTTHASRSTPDHV